MSDSDSEREQPKVLGKISREERSELFQQFVDDSSDLYRVEARSTIWTDPSVLLEIVNEGIEEGEVIRTYFFMGEKRAHPDLLPSFHEAAKFKKGPTGVWLYTYGAADPSLEGKQILNYLPGQKGVTIEAEEKGTNLLLEYDESGNLVNIRFKVPKDTTGKALSQNLGLNKTYAPFQKTKTGDGQEIAIWNYSDQGFVQCWQKDQEGNDNNSYRIPKHVNIRAGIGKLIPAELMEDPYHAPATYDKWRTADFMEVFGVERIEPQPENLKL